MCLGLLLDVEMWYSTPRKSNSLVLLSCGATALWTCGPVVLAGERGTSVRAEAEQKGGMQNFGCSIYSQGVGRGARRQVEVEVRSAPVPVMKRSVRFGYYDLLIDNNN